MKASKLSDGHMVGISIFVRPQIEALSDLLREQLTRTASAETDSVYDEELMAGINDHISLQIVLLEIFLCIDPGFCESRRKDILKQISNISAFELFRVNLEAMLEEIIASQQED